MSSNISIFSVRSSNYMSICISNLSIITYFSNFTSIFISNLSIITYFSNITSISISNISIITYFSNITSICISDLSIITYFSNNTSIFIFNISILTYFSNYMSICISNISIFSSSIIFIITTSELTIREKKIMIKFTSLFSHHLLFVHLYPVFYYLPKLFHRQYYQVLFFQFLFRVFYH